MSDITSRPYRPEMACEHSLWCEHSRPTAWRLEGNPGSGGEWLYQRYMNALEATPEDKSRWLYGDWANVKETE